MGKLYHAVHYIPPWSWSRSPQGLPGSASPWPRDWPCHDWPICQDNKKPRVHMLSADAADVTCKHCIRVLAFWVTNRLTCQHRNAASHYHTCPDCGEDPRQ